MYKKKFIIKFLILTFVFLNALAVKCIVSHRENINKEWQNKVNTCIMEPTSRMDCKLIIYRDKQMHGQNTDDNLLMYSAGMAVGMSLNK